jgi:hypothetical protein
MGPSGELTVGGTAWSVDQPAIPGPVVFCPFPPRCSPHVDELTRFAMWWATRHGFLADSERTGAFARSRFARLVARVYPDASLPDLYLAMCCLTLVVMLDDHLETVLGHEPVRQRRAAAEMVAFLKDPPPGDRWPAPRVLTRSLGRPLAGAVADVWALVTARTDPAWQERFVAHVAAYLEANAWEADNRRTGRTPTMDEYARMRRDSSATELFFDLVEALAPEPLTPEALAGANGAVTRTLRGHAHHAVAWFNDLVSWRKELQAGDRHNLVLVVRHELRLSLPDAVRYVVECHDAQVHAFVATRAMLGPEPGVQALADGLAHWIRGNVDWSRETGRYAPAEAET